VQLPTGDQRTRGRDSGVSVPLNLLSKINQFECDPFNGYPLEGESDECYFESKILALVPIISIEDTIECSFTRYERKRCGMALQNEVLQRKKK